MALMPGCTGGSGGAPSGCHLLGFSLNWFVALGIASLVASLMTVPVGVLTLLFAAVASALSRRSEKDVRKKGEEG